MYMQGRIQVSKLGVVDLIQKFSDMFYYSIPYNHKKLSLYKPVYKTFFLIRKTFTYLNLFG